GQSRARSDRDLITLQESEMEDTFEFQVGEQQYRVFRRRSGAAQRLTLEFHSRRLDGDEWHAITGDNVTDTERRIKTAIRMDYDTFINSAFLLQGRADTFTQKTPGERKRILGEILGLSEYDELTTLARERSRQRSGRLDLIREQVVQIEAELAEHPDLEEDLERVQIETANLSERASEIDAKRTRLGERVHELRSLRQFQERACERKKKREDERATLEAQVRETKKQIAERDEILKREREIEAGYESLQAARKQVEQHNARLQQLGPLQNEQRRLSDAIQTERQALRQQLQVSIERRDQFDKRLQELAQLDEELSNIAERRNAVEVQLRQFDDAEKAKEKAVARITELRTKNRNLRENMAEIQERIEAIEQGHATCPICRRPLDEHDQVRIKEEWAAEGKVLGDAYRANKAEIEEQEKAVARLDEQLTVIRNLQKDIADLDARKKECERQLKQRDQLADQRSTAEAEIAKLEVTLNDESFAQEERDNLQRVEEQITDIGYDAEAHTRANQELKSLEEFDSEHRKLEQARIERNSFLQSVADREARVKEVNDEISSLKDEIETLEKQLSGAEEAEKSYKEIVEEAELVSRQQRELDQEKASLVALSKHLSQRKQTRNELQRETRELARDVDAYRELATAFGRNGIQTTIIESVIPELQDEANALLRRMSANYLEVTFSTSRQAQTRDSMIDTLDIIIHDEQGQRPYEMYSGGEAFRINFAIRIALSKLLARRAGATIDLLVIDEGFGTQDAQGRDGLIEALRSVEPTFSMILVITHIDEVRDMFPRRIDVLKTTQGSRVTVN
ncbi:MAG: SbcC/MukB-like Walker B domain-containing protein, partial [Chloroflexota bacterium]